MDIEYLANRLENEIFEWKRILIGGSFDKGGQQLMEHEENDGHIKWVTIDESIELDKLKRVERSSMKAAVLIPDKAVRKEAEEVFSKKR